MQITILENATYDVRIVQKGFDVFEDDFDVRNCVLKLRVVVGDSMSERDEMRMKVPEFERNKAPPSVRNLAAGFAADYL